VEKLGKAKYFWSFELISSNLLQEEEGEPEEKKIGKA
jgi:hypothetical protein